MKEKKINAEFVDFQEKFLGEFVFFIFENLELLTDVMNDINLSRFVYLGTFVRKDGYLKKDDNKTYLTKKDLKEMLGISRNCFGEFYNFLIEYEMIVQDSKKIKINPNYFFKGNVKNHENEYGIKVRDNYTRLYIKSIRELYENINKRRSGSLAIMYKLLPYVNIYHNVLCKNIFEKDLRSIIPLTLENVFLKLGYTKDRHGLSRFKKEIKDIGSENKRVFGFFIKGDRIYESMIFFNPAYFYMGADLKDVKFLLFLFQEEIIDKN